MIKSVIVTNKGYKDLNPVSFGFQDCEPSYSFGPAVRRYWTIHFVVSGFGFYRIEDREYRLSPGEMFVIPPLVKTYYEADSKDPWSYIWINFEAGEPLPVELGDILHCPEAESIFFAMKKCSELKNATSEFLCSKLWELFSLLAENEKTNTGYIEKALECIHSEYMNDITVEMIANRLSLDRTYFSTVFKKKVGVSPKQYLLNYRMKIASSLMKENKTSVSVTAYSVGYTDVFTFSKMFKRYYGIAPNDYIKANRKKPD